MEKPIRVRKLKCAWCSKPLQIMEGHRGRPPKYCSQSCRQRAYEQRNGVFGTSIPAQAVIMNPARARELSDQLFELRCLAEDINTAAKEGVAPEEMQQLTAELVALAQRVERLRVTD